MSAPSNSESGSLCNNLSGCRRSSRSFRAQWTDLIVNVPLESSITTFCVVSGSSNFERCPGPEPRSRIVLKCRLMSYSIIRTKHLGTGTSNTHHETFDQSVRNFISNIVYSPTSLSTFTNRRTVLLKPLCSSIKYLVWSHCV